AGSPAGPGHRPWRTPLGSGPADRFRTRDVAARAGAQPVLRQSRGARRPRRAAAALAGLAGAAGLPGRLRARPVRTKGPGPRQLAGARAMLSDSVVAAALALLGGVADDLAGLLHVLADAGDGVAAGEGEAGQQGDQQQAGTAHGQSPGKLARV